jgi:hypothetical protein
VIKPLAFLLMLMFASSVAATNTAPVAASTRGWAGFVRIQGDRPGQAGYHVSSRGLTAALQPAPTASPKSNIAVASAVKPSPKINTGVVTMAAPSPSPTGGPVSEACDVIALAFTPTGQAAVHGTYQPDGGGGCLFAFPLAGNAPETGTLYWKVIQMSGASGGGAGKAKFGPLTGPGPTVTLRPNQTTQIEVGYDPYTNTTLYWPR